MANKHIQTSGKPMGMWESISLVWEIGYLIAIPAALMGFLGAYTDKMYGTTPLLTILGLCFALLVSSFAVYRRVKAISNF